MTKNFYHFSNNLHNQLNYNASLRKGSAWIKYLKSLKTKYPDNVYIKFLSSNYGISSIIGLLTLSNILAILSVNFFPPTSLIYLVGSIFLTSMMPRMTGLLIAVIPTIELFQKEKDEISSKSKIFSKFILNIFHLVLSASIISLGIFLLNYNMMFISPVITNLLTTTLISVGSLSLITGLNNFANHIEEFSGDRNNFLGKLAVKIKQISQKSSSILTNSNLKNIVNIFVALTGLILISKASNLLVINLIFGILGFGLTILGPLISYSFQSIHQIKHAKRGKFSHISEYVSNNLNSNEREKLINKYNPEISHRNIYKNYIKTYGPEIILWTGIGTSSIIFASLNIGAPLWISLLSGVITCGYSLFHNFGPNAASYIGFMAENEAIYKAVLEIEKQLPTQVKTQKNIDEKNIKTLSESNNVSKVKNLEKFGKILKNNIIHDITGAEIISYNKKTRAQQILTKIKENYNEEIHL